MKRKRAYDPVDSGKQARIARMRGQIMANRAIVPVRTGLSRTGGFYGRYGESARRMGMKPELKFLDTGIVAALVDSTAEIPSGGQVCLIPQGDTESTRDGRQCTIESIVGRGSLLFAPGAGTSPATVVYLYVIQDTQCNGAAAAVGDVFTGTNFATAFHNLANSKRFIVLKKLIVTMNSTCGVTTAYGPTIRPINFAIKKNIPMEYSSTTGAIGEIKSNNVFYMVGSDGNSDDLVTFTMNTRIRFRG